MENYSYTQNTPKNVLSEPLTSFGEGYQTLNSYQQNGAYETYKIPYALSKEKNNLQNEDDMLYNETSLSSEYSRFDYHPANYSPMSFVRKDSTYGLSYNGNQPNSNEGFSQRNSWAGIL